MMMKDKYDIENFYNKRRKIIEADLKASKRAFLMFFFGFVLLLILVLT